MEEELIEQVNEEIAEDVSLFDNLVSMFDMLENNTDLKDTDVDSINIFYDTIISKDTVKRLCSIDNIEDLFVEAFNTYVIKIESEKSYNLLLNIINKMHSNISIDCYKEGLRSISNE